jgi:hypothetical protein
LLAGATSLPRGELLAGISLVLWALLNLGGIFEQRPWALASEFVRLPVTAVLLGARLPAGPWLLPAQAGLAAAVVVSWLCILAYRREFRLDRLNYGAREMVACHDEFYAPSHLSLSPTAGHRRAQ